MSTGDTLSIDLTDEMIMFPLCFLSFCLIMAYNSFSNKIERTVDKIEDYANFMKDVGKALVTWNKTMLVLLLSLGIAGCNKSSLFDLDCTYGDGTIQARQPTNTLQVSSQHNVDIPLVIEVQDWSECTEKGDVKIEGFVVDNATGLTIANSHFFEVRKGIPEGDNRSITQSVHVPYTCGGITVKYEVSSNTNETTIGSNYRPKRERRDEGVFSYNLVH